MKLNKLLNLGLKFCKTFANINIIFQKASQKDFMGKILH